MDTYILVRACAIAVCVYVSQMHVLPLPWICSWACLRLYKARLHLTTVRQLCSFRGNHHQVPACRVRVEDVDSVYVHPVSAIIPLIIMATICRPICSWCHRLQALCNWYWSQIWMPFPWDSAGTTNGTYIFMEPVLTLPRCLHANMHMTIL